MLSLGFRVQLQLSSRRRISRVRVSPLDAFNLSLNRDVLALVVEIRMAVMRPRGGVTADADGDCEIELGPGLMWMPTGPFRLPAHPTIK